MSWHNPVPAFTLEPTNESESFRTMAPGETGIPLPPHPGSFGFVRKNHVHEGVDLYVPEGTEVVAVESGVVVAVLAFTGPLAGSSWWKDTQAVLVAGDSGTVCYGEVETVLMMGEEVETGSRIGTVKQVLGIDKGRPMSMLHLELYQPRTCDVVEWKIGEAQPMSLCNPTSQLLRVQSKCRIKHR